MVPPLKPWPAGTVICAVANGPYVAATLATVGSGPRWYGLSAADADCVVTATAAVRSPRTIARTAVPRRDSRPMKPDLAGLTGSVAVGVVTRGRIGIPPRGT